MLEERASFGVKDVERLVLAANYSGHPERNSCMIQLHFIHDCWIHELTALTLRDVDLPGKRIYIHRERYGVSGYHFLRPQEVILLQNWLVARECYPAHNDLLFISSRGNKMTRQSFNQVVRECCRLAQISSPANTAFLQDDKGDTW